MRRSPAERDWTLSGVQERPIPFIGPMVRAIFEGRKTQTRLVVSDRNSQGNFRASELLIDDPRTCVDHGPSPAGNPGDYLHAYVDALKIEAKRGWKRGDCDSECIERLYPRWMPGNRLWVKETWQMVDEDGEADASESLRSRLGATAPFKGIQGSRPITWRAVYRADGEAEHPNYGPIVWRRSIHMPRWASRLTLEVVAVRVERLQEISEADAIAEGASRREIQGHSAGWSMDWSRVGQLSRFAGGIYQRGSEQPLTERDICLGSARMAFGSLWNSINAKRGHGWDANPWVWVIEFRRVDG